MSSESPIPHRGKMLWIDADSPQEVVIPHDHPFLRDGFLPRTAIIEFLAQSAACQSARDGAGAGKRVEQGRLVAIKGLRFQRDLRAGEKLTMQLTPGAAFGKLSQAHAVAIVGGEVVAEGELTFHVEMG